MWSLWLCFHSFSVFEGRQLGVSRGLVEEHLYAPVNSDTRSGSVLKVEFCIDWLSQASYFKRRESIMVFKCCWFQIKWFGQHLTRLQLENNAMVMLLKLHLPKALPVGSWVPKYCSCCSYYFCIALICVSHLCHNILVATMVNICNSDCALCAINSALRNSSVTELSKCWSYSSLLTRNIWFKGVKWLDLALFRPSRAEPHWQLCVSNQCLNHIMHACINIQRLSSPCWVTAWEDFMEIMVCLFFTLS